MWLYFLAKSLCAPYSGKGIPHEGLDKLETSFLTISKNGTLLGLAAFCFAYQIILDEISIVVTCSARLANSMKYLPGPQPISRILDSGLIIVIHRLILENSPGFPDQIPVPAHQKLVMLS